MTTTEVEVEVGLQSYSLSRAIFASISFQLATTTTTVIRAFWKGWGFTAIYQPAALLPAHIRKLAFCLVNAPGKGFFSANTETL